MNENTENSRIEVERQQNECEDKNEDLDEKSNQNCRQTGCDNKNTIENSQEEDSKTPIRVHEELKKLNEHIASRNNSKDFLVIERSLFSTSSSDNPSCSGVSTNKTSNDISSTSTEDQHNDSKRHNRKRRNEGDSSSSEDESNRSKKRHCKVLVPDGKPGTLPTSENVASLMENNVGVDGDQPSTSGCGQRNAAERQAPNNVVGENSSPEARNEEDRNGPNLGSVLLNAYCLQPPRVDDGPEIHRDAGDFRCQRNNAENAR